MNNWWIKLYHEMLEDPKVGRLTDSQYRTMIECFLLAGRENLEGALPAVEDIAWQLRKDLEQLKSDFAALAAAGILTETAQGWVVTNYTKRQTKISNADKQKAYRDRSRHDFMDGYEEERISNVDSYQSVTDGNTEEEKKKIREEEEKEKEIEVEREEIFAAAAAETKVLVEKTFALAEIDISAIKPPQKLVYLFAKMAESGVIVEDIENAWRWYTDKNGFAPRTFDVLHRPIMTAKAQRLQKSAPQTQKVSDYADYIQR